MFYGALLAGLGLFLYFLVLAPLCPECSPWDPRCVIGDIIDSIFGPG